MTPTNRAVALRTATPADPGWTSATGVSTWAPLAGDGQEAAQ